MAEGDSGAPDYRELDVRSYSLPKAPGVPPFREFFQMRNGAPFPAVGHEPIHLVVQRLAETCADFMDELRKAR